MPLGVIMATSRRLKRGLEKGMCWGLFNSLELDTEVVEDIVSSSQALTLFAE